MSDDDLRAELKAEIDRVSGLIGIWSMQPDQYYMWITQATEARSTAQQALDQNDIDAMRSSLETLRTF